MKPSLFGLSRLLMLFVCLVVGMLAPSLGNPEWGEQRIFAQEEKAPASVPAEAETNPSPESSVPIPHTKFLLDYVIVLALVAFALYAVCRSSRRV